MNDVFTWPVGRNGVKQARTARDRAPGIPVFAYACAAGASGSVTGTVFGWVGGLTTNTLPGVGVLGLLMLFAAAGFFLIVLEFAGAGSVVPQRRAQVPRTWLLWRSRTHTALGFGWLIGGGVYTPLRFGTAYVLAGGIFFSGEAAVGLAIGGLYGLSRGFALVTVWLSDVLRRPRINWEAMGGSRTVARVVASSAAVGLAATVIATLHGVQYG